MLDQWLKLSLDLCEHPADFYSGCRKIIRTRKFTFDKIENDLSISDAGYTKSKLTLLRGHYLHHESRDVAVALWNKRLGQRTYGSVSFTCFAHFVKGGSIDAKRSKRASVFGPCIQAVSITYMKDHTASVDVFYRTTELLKKFPADLVFLRDELLAPFNFEDVPLKTVTFHFANITIHPMYFVTIIPLLKDPLKAMRRIKRRDVHFHDWLVKWTARYVVPEYHRGIAKFSQALRVKMDAEKRIKKEVMPSLQQYLIDNHPGHQNEYEDDTDPDE